MKSIVLICFFGNFCRLIIAQSRKLYQVAVEQWAPFAYVSNKNGMTTFDGPMKRLVEILSEKLNIAYNFSQPPDGKWGFKNEKGDWSGMLGMIQRGEVEFAVGPFMRNYDRARDFDFAETIFTDFYTIMLPRPTTSPDIFAFLRALESEVYVSIIVFLFGISVTLFVINIIERRMNKTKETFGFIDSLIWVTQALFQEGTETHINTTASRILTAVWLAVTLIFMKSYEGALTSMLNVPTVNIPIDSIEDLSAQEDLPWKLEAASVTYQYFKENENPVEKRIYNKLSGLVPDCFTPCGDVAQGKYAVVCDMITTLKCMDWDFSQHGRCNIYAARNPVITGVASSMVFKKNFTLLPEVNSWIQKLKQAGFFTHWVYDQLGNASFCDKPPSTTVKETEFKYLGMDNFIGCFYIFAFGSGLGFLAFLVELLANQMKKNFG